MSLGHSQRFLPVRMFWKAVSTFVESNAEVSMNDRLFFSADEVGTKISLVCLVRGSFKSKCPCACSWPLANYTAKQQASAILLLHNKECAQLCPNGCTSLKMLRDTLTSEILVNAWGFWNWSAHKANEFDWVVAMTMTNLPANALASSVGTARRCLRSLLFPTSIMTMLLSAWSRSSFNQRSTFSYVRCLAMSYTNNAPTAPR